MAGWVSDRVGAAFYFTRNLFKSLFTPVANETVGFAGHSFESAGDFALNFKGTPSFRPNGSGC